MLKSSTIAACVLALSGSVALAQTVPAPTGAAPAPAQQGQTLAPGSTAAPTPTPSLGSPSSTAQGPSAQRGDYGQGVTPYSQGMQDQGMQNQASAPGDMDNPRAVSITDEYGNQYNSRGERIGRGRPAAPQQMR